MKNAILVAMSYSPENTSEFVNPSGGTTKGGLQFELKLFSGM